MDKALDPVIECPLVYPGEAESAKGYAVRAETAAKRAEDVVGGLDSLQGLVDAAAGSATAAAGSAAAASNSETASKNSAEAAAGSADAAASSAEGAESSKEAAASRAQAAKDSAVASAASKAAAETAAKAAQDAKTAAAAAKAEAVKAPGAAQTAAKSAQDAQAAAEKVRDEAKAAQKGAEAARDTAAKSAEAAAKSEANAKQSADTLAESVENVVANTAAVAELKEKKAEIDDTAVGVKAWSSKHIIDMLCPPLEEGGNPVACYPVAGYPLGVKAKWEPMQEGTGTPSPENIRPIKGRDSVRVERCGENLFDIGKVAETNLLTKTDRQITLKTGRVHNYDLFVSTVGLTTDVSVDYLYRLPFFPKGTYKISYNTTLPGASLSIVAVAKDGSITVISTNSQAYFTLSYGTLISIRCGPVEEVTFSNIQITIGSTAPTTYTPYIGQTNTLTLPETVYGGEVDAVSGDVKETWKTLTLDGTENWIKWESSNTALFTNAFGNRRSLDLKAICSHIMTTKSIVPWVDLVNRMQVVDNAIGVNIAGKTEDVETWKSYLAAQYAAGTPVQICYVPAKHVPFTATGAQPLPALAGVNTVLTDADSAAVTGRADPIKRITDLEDATASQT